MARKNWTYLSWGGRSEALTKRYGYACKWYKDKLALYLRSIVERCWSHLFQSLIAIHQKLFSTGACTKSPTIGCQFMSMMSFRWIANQRMSGYDERGPNYGQFSKGMWMVLIPITSWV